MVIYNQVEQHTTYTTVSSDVIAFPGWRKTATSDFCSGIDATSLNIECGPAQGSTAQDFIGRKGTCLQ